MLNIPAPRPRIRAASASIDTIETFCPMFPRAFVGDVESIVGRRPEVRRGDHGGFRIGINRPPAQVLPVIRQHVEDRENRAVVRRVDLAYDLTTDDPDGLAAWLDHRLVLKWRSPSARKVVYRTTIYWCDKTKARNIALYQKRSDVIRLELRFFRAATVRRAGLHDLDRLPTINPKELFDHNVRAWRLSEKYAIKVMRNAVKDDIKRSRGKNGSRFLDAYRSTIAKRVRSILLRIDGQMLGRSASEDVDLELLHIPEELTWPSLRALDNSEEIAGVGLYHGGMP